MGSFYRDSSEFYEKESGEVQSVDQIINCSSQFIQAISKQLNELTQTIFSKLCMRFSWFYFQKISVAKCSSKIIYEIFERKKLLKIFLNF